LSVRVPAGILKKIAMRLQENNRYVDVNFTTKKTKEKCWTFLNSNLVGI
jgi:hypothetical protein